ncbi:unnamed protein product [Spirodela intermedia]|uniref:Uncharacterized protein n=1 Tax=Spirodela intermedia TaxID=51605 RepID=A0A7I8J8M9_SPIIN|nr:unnamed protein product [Spirodela intermedia]CAA6666115.1 unnamed protein product [Spirodela intermedia]
MAEIPEQQPTRSHSAEMQGEMRENNSTSPRPSPPQEKPRVLILLVAQNSDQSIPH